MLAEPVVRLISMLPLLAQDQAHLKCLPLGLRKLNEPLMQRAEQIRNGCESKDGF
jgi:hypothetical protein